MKNFKKTSLLTGTLVAGVLFTTSNVSATNLLDFDYLGTGAQLRSQLLSGNSSILLTSATDGLKSIEGACGEKKTETKTDSKSKEAKTKDAKCGEGKCGEGKCGDKKTEKKADKKSKKEAKKSEAKSKDAKCGEGKCGGKKASK
ncbi:hypothetical protein [Flavobacterium sp. '19STA2R22 D10 B1']|uniref:hypothetical protein n=1 Tax=Flavobacterium aerium TaxID=3037261 RepID=UPI00278BE7C2|nr:hypothetical protein [Flavobacterium sp. '19STA2R22 D10 B1']